METSYKKSILKTILYTLITLIVASLLVGCLMFFVFTKTTANLMYNMGCDNIASNLYFKTYKNSGEIEYCYKSLNLKIKLNNSEDIIEYYEILIEDDAYSEFIESIVDRNEKLSIGVLEKSSMLNEENFLVNKYVRALIDNKMNDKAWDVAIDHFSTNNTWSFNDQGVYALSHFVSNADGFDDYEEKLGGIVLDEMQACFDKVYQLFNDSKNVSSNIEKSYLMSLGNRIINIGKDINNLYGNNDSYASIKLSNSEAMSCVNEVIKGLI